MATQPRGKMTVDEYLAFERAALEKHEYFGGEIYAMAGASYRHGRLLLNTAAKLRGLLRPLGCEPNGPDLRVAVPGTPKFFTYPDVVVTCGKPQFLDGDLDTLLNPVAIIEVLSPSTESYDRGLKFQRYREIESLREVAFVAQDHAQVQSYRRSESGAWQFTEANDLSAHIEIANVSLALADIYDGVEVPTHEEWAALVQEAMEKANKPR